MRHITSNSFFDTLHYQGLFTSKKYQIRIDNTLQSVEHSPLKNRNDTIPLKLINPQPNTRQKPDSHLVSLAIISALASSIFFLTAFYGNLLWAIIFGLVLLTASIAALISSFKNSTTIYDFYRENTNTRVLSLNKTLSEGADVETFMDILRSRISEVGENSNVSIDKQPIKRDENIYFDAEKNGYDEKKSQYIKHIDFLFNHGIVDEKLYKQLEKKIDNKVMSSEILKSNSESLRDSADNIIYFPVNSVVART